VLVAFLSTFQVQGKLFSLLKGIVVAAYAIFFFIF